MRAALSESARQYAIVTGNYWAFTLTDGALRMLVVLHFHALGYTALDIALLFVFYEFFGIVTNLFGGWLGTRLGLNRTMNTGLLLQIVALALLLPAGPLSVAWVMAAQGLSGIAKDLNKMSAKSAIKMLIPEDADSRLFRWVALLTGSKNTLKGIGFFLGGALLSWFGFRGAILAMTVMLTVVWVLSLVLLRRDLGKTRHKPAFRDIFSKSRAINVLSAARLFLFAARDVWFVVALPVYLASQLGWSHWGVGSLLAAWVIAYGVVQGFAPGILGHGGSSTPNNVAAATPRFNPRRTVPWALLLALAPLGLALGLSAVDITLTPERAGWLLLSGLALFGFLFAINSSLHSYLVVRFARREGVSMDVSFYYMANAAGRLLGTVLSGWLYQSQGLVTCLWVSFVFIVVTALISLLLPVNEAAC